MTTLVDTGPLVAVLNRRDRHHGWAKGHLGRLAPPLLTCEAVLSEASYLLGHSSQGGRALLAMVERGAVRVDFRLQEEASRVRALMQRYATVPMALADACLVRMAELHADATVWTVDGDFRIYRKNGREVIPTLLPQDE